MKTFTAITAGARTLALHARRQTRNGAILRHPAYTAVAPVSRLCNRPWTRSFHTTWMRGSSVKPNRLIDEKSPYLLQHAHNPVDWYPWGEAAFQRAKAENKPIFLSIGYSTCHWCHVMEHESFQNEETASFMNKHFINIKVDREENPAVDKLYMTYIQLIAGRGGWPMSVFLTPDLAPFFGGTYFPPGDQHGTPGFRTLLQRVSEIWNAAPESVIENAEEMVSQLRAYTAPKERVGQMLEPEKVAMGAYNHFEHGFDAEHGGFTGAPKFPTPVQLRFLLEYYGYTKHEKSDKGKQALGMTLFTLQQIAAGGIHDHIGHGFHRYSTDKYWHVPHFEKMLYDQGQLLSVYALAHQITNDKLYANVAKDIIQYVSRDLRHPKGGFYSAEDADSLPTKDSDKKREGAYYVWDRAELDSVLGPDNARVVAHYYGVKDNGNVNPALDPHNELEGKNVLASQASVASTAEHLGLSVDQVSDILSKAKTTLWEYRLKHKPKPHLDDKILTSWNGLMISGLAQASQALQDKEALALAKQAAQFIKDNMYNPDTKILLRSYRNGPSSIEGVLEDYSYLIQGLLDLYEATFDEQWVSWAHDLQETQNDLFYDTENGGYFNVQESDKSILVRLKDEQDGAEPSANAVTLKNLVRLGTMLEKESYADMARTTIESFEGAMAQFPFAMPALVSSFLLMANGVKQIVLAGPNDSRMKAFEEIAARAFVPNKVVLRAEKGGILADKNPIVAQIAAQDNEPAAYICENFTCGLPIHDVGQLRKVICQE